MEAATKMGRRSEAQEKMQSLICRPIIFCHGRCRTDQGNYKTLPTLPIQQSKPENMTSYAGTTLANLNKAFDDIQKQITELACTNVHDFRSAE